MGTDELGTLWSDRPKRMFFDLAIVLVIIRFSLPCFGAILGDKARGESCDRFIWATDGGEVELLSTAVDCKGSFMTSHLIGFCHGSTGSPSALSEEDSKGGVTVLEGSKVLARGTRSCT